MASCRSRYCLKTLTTGLFSLPAICCTGQSRCRVVVVVELLVELLVALLVVVELLVELAVALVVVLLDRGCVLVDDELPCGIDVVALLVVDELLMVIGIVLVVLATMLMFLITISPSATDTLSVNALYPVASALRV